MLTKAHFICGYLVTYLVIYSHNFHKKNEKKKKIEITCSSMHEVSYVVKNLIIITVMMIMIISTF